MTSQSTPHGLPPGELRDGESVLRSWRFHHHWVVLTTRRCLGLSGLDILPEHRRILWAVDLDQVRCVEVLDLAATERTTEYTQALSRGMWASPGGPGTAVALSPTGLATAKGPEEMLSTAGDFAVLLDDTMVFRGYPRDAEAIQGEIERARNGSPQA